MTLNLLLEYKLPLILHDEIVKALLSHQGIPNSKKVAPLYTILSRTSYAKSAKDLQSFVEANKDVSLEVLVVDLSLYNKEVAKKLKTYLQTMVIVDTIETKETLKAYSILLDALKEQNTLLKQNKSLLEEKVVMLEELLKMKYRKDPVNVL